MNKFEQFLRKILAPKNWKMLKEMQEERKMRDQKMYVLYDAFDRPIIRVHTTK
jgi:hypothetical protein